MVVAERFGAPPMTGENSDLIGNYDGVDAPSLATRWGVPLVAALHSTGSTLDDAHRLAEVGAPHRALVLADQQTGGRGRHGKRWLSEPGQGIWLTLLARDLDAATVGVLSIRLGLAIAAPLDRFAPEHVQLKWPNDVYVEGRKLAGILVEARWQAGRASWVAIGVGINVRTAARSVGGAALRAGTERLDVLDAVVPALIAALGERGALHAAELSAFASRDLAAGLACSSPCSGRVLGLAADGGLRVETPEGVRTMHTGSLVLTKKAKNQ